MSIGWLLVGFPVAFLLTLALTPVVIRLTRRWGIVDHPHDRGIHRVSIPLAGGLGFCVPILLLSVITPLVAPGFVPRLTALTMGGFAIMILGVLDDIYRLKPWLKLAGEIVVVTFMFAFGYRIEILTNPLGSDIILNWMSFPVTLFWYLLVTNAFNLIDGIDGLAAGIALIAGIMLSVVGIGLGNDSVVWITALVAGGCAAFLIFNFAPARTFMGDTGSLFLGFIMATIPITGHGQIKGITAMTMLIPIVSMLLPLFDTFLAVFRRLRSKRHIFHGDKMHLHHRLLDLGLSQSVVALIMYFVTFMFGVIAIGFSYATKRMMVVILLVLAAILMGTLYVLLHAVTRFNEKRKLPTTGE